MVTVSLRPYHKGPTLEALEATKPKWQLLFLKRRDAASPKEPVSSTK